MLSKEKKILRKQSTIIWRYKEKNKTKNVLININKKNKNNH
jgi:hypothetical protein